MSARARDVDLIVPANAVRRWHHEVARRLEARGARVRLFPGPPEPAGASGWLALSLERRFFSGAPDDLADPLPTRFESGSPSADAILDLTGRTPGLRPGALQLSFEGCETLIDLAAVVAAGRQPVIRLSRAGALVAEARPMTSSRPAVVAGLDDTLARAISLAVNGCAGEFSPLHHGAAGAAPDRPAQGFLSAYLLNALPRLGLEFARRRIFRTAHWRVGYRFNHGPGVAETGGLEGGPWRVLPDDGSRFYADPFPFVGAKGNFIFVEDYSHATGQACISVSEVREGGEASTPRPVLAPGHHLSYPQVFERDGEIWMLPESTAARNLVLYRAVSFPDVWEPEAVLLDDVELADATLLEENGSLWLFAALHDGAGSSSDMLAVYRSESLVGPWTPHPANPVLIDVTRARPGGAFLRIDGRTFLPVQDGTWGYGGGLGIAELTGLCDRGVSLSQPVPIRTAAAGWPYPRIHTLNRAGPLEVIDGIAQVPKWRGRE